MRRAVPGGKFIGEWGESPKHDISVALDEPRRMIPGDGGAEGQDDGKPELGLGFAEASKPSTQVGDLHGFQSHPTVMLEFA